MVEDRFCCKNLTSDAQEIDINLMRSKRSSKVMSDNWQMTRLSFATESALVTWWVWWVLVRMAQSEQIQESQSMQKYSFSIPGWMEQVSRDLTEGWFASDWEEQQSWTSSPTSSSQLHFTTLSMDKAVRQWGQVSFCSSQVYSDELKWNWKIESVNWMNEWMNENTFIQSRQHSFEQQGKTQVSETLSKQMKHLKSSLHAESILM